MSTNTRDRASFAHCHDCQEPIPYGLAVLRSRSFVPIALCRRCGYREQGERDSVAERSAVTAGQLAEDGSVVMRSA